MSNDDPEAGAPDTTRPEGDTLHITVSPQTMHAFSAFARDLQKTAKKVLKIDGLPAEERGVLERIAAADDPSALVTLALEIYQRPDVLATLREIEEKASAGALNISPARQKLLKRVRDAVEQETPALTPEARASLPEGTRLTLSIIDAIATPREPTEDEIRALKVAQVRETELIHPLPITTYPEDSAVRKASQASPEKWKREGDTAVFRDDELRVYLSSKDKTPLSFDEAMHEIARIRPGVIVAIRIMKGLWHLYRHDPARVHRGDVAITLGEIAHWRGEEKRQRDGYTNGYPTHVLDRIREEVRQAGLFIVDGVRTVYIANPGRGRPHTQRLATSDHYLRVTFVEQVSLWGERSPVGVFVGPGHWYDDHADAGSHFYLLALQGLFSLNPQNEQHAMRIGHYLVERFRERHKGRRYAEPISMRELLEESGVEVNDHNLTSRFVPRIRQALDTLREKGIVGSVEQLTPVDETKARWGRDWLESRWRILPPWDTETENAQLIRPPDGPPALAAPVAKPGKSSTRKPGRGAN